MLLKAKNTTYEGSLPALRPLSNSLNPYRGFGVHFVNVMQIFLLLVSGATKRIATLSQAWSFFQFPSL